jgi:hypothetical protein
MVQLIQGARESLLWLVKADCKYNNPQQHVRMLMAVSLKRLFPSESQNNQEATQMLAALAVFNRQQQSSYSSTPSNIM